MLSLLKSEHASELSLEELTEIQSVLDAFPVELAVLRASAKQRAFMEAFFARQRPDGSPLDIFVALGGNRSGKSIVAGWLCFAMYLRYVARAGSLFWCVSPTLDRSIGGVQKELWNALPKWMFGKQRWDEKIGFGMHRKIVLPTQDGGKCLVEFRSADQDPTTFEQAKLDGVWADERIPEEIYDRLLPRIIDRRGFILYSDIPEQFWQYERLVNAEPAAGIYCQPMAMEDNRHNLPEGAIEQAAARMTEDEKKLRIKGLFTVMEGVVYKEYVDELGKDGHQVRPFRIPAAWPRWRSIDYGSSAPTACVWFAAAPDETIYIYREHYERGKNVPTNAAMIIAASGDEQYAQTFMDPHAVDKPPAVYGASPSVADQYAAAGIQATGWPFVQVMGEHAMVQRVKYRLENRTIKVFTTCTNVRREFRSWKYKTDKNGKPLAADAFENDNNHALDAIKGFIATNPCYQRPEVSKVGRR
jgi:hypothetical protein